jgi:hypothetical protein
MGAGSTPLRMPCGAQADAAARRGNSRLRLPDISITLPAANESVGSTPNAADLELPIHIRRNDASRMRIDAPAGCWRLQVPVMETDDAI